MPVTRRELLFAAALNYKKGGPFGTDEKQSTFQDVTHYNNFYEFGTGKDQPAQFASKLKTSPWTVSVEGECAKPHMYDIEELKQVASQEERVYRHRCVGAMVDRGAVDRLSPGGVD